MENPTNTKPFALYHSPATNGTFAGQFNSIGIDIGIGVAVAVRAATGQGRQRLVMAWQPALERRLAMEQGRAADRFRWIEGARPPGGRPDG